MTSKEIQKDILQNLYTRQGRINCSNICKKYMHEAYYSQGEYLNSMGYIDAEFLPRSISGRLDFCAIITKEGIKYLQELP